MTLTQVQLDDVRRRAEVAGDADVLALVDELQRLRTPTGDPGRAGYDAYGDARGWRVFSGAPMPTWEQQLEKTPDFAAAWVRAGQAERAVAYTLAAGCVTPSDADAVRKLAHPPASAAERMARVASLLREAGALSAEVLTDAEAEPGLRAVAEIASRMVVSESTALASLRCWQVRCELGPPSADMQPSSLLIWNAATTTQAALTSARAAARSHSSPALGSALAYLERTAELLAKAQRLDPVENEFPRQQGLRELTQASEEAGDYFGGPVVPVRAGDVWVDPSGVEWTASKPGAKTNVFIRSADGTLILADHPSTHGWRRKGDGA
jgi:hypothetical protein